MQTPDRRIPDSWVDRLFIRMTAIYGAQKTGVMWADVPIEERREVWGTALGRFSPAALAAAVNGLADSAGSWPPTLPEFVQLCREASADAAHKQPLMLPDDSEVISRERAQELLAQIRQQIKTI